MSATHRCIYITVNKLDDSSTIQQLKSLNRTLLFAASRIKDGRLKKGQNVLPDNMHMHSLHIVLHCLALSCIVLHCLFGSRTEVSLIAKSKLPQPHLVSSARKGNEASISKLKHQGITRDVEVMRADIDNS